MRHNSPAEAMLAGRATIKALTAFGLAMMTTFLLLIGSQAAPKPAHAATTLTVNSTGNEEDDNQGNGVCDIGVETVDGTPVCTLRAAIQEANAAAGADTIKFNIPTTDPGRNPTTGVFTISPNSQLPEITGPVTIEGYSQSGATKNTQEAPGGRIDARPLIELNGTNAPGGSEGASGLFMRGADNSVVEGLVINRFGAGGIAIVDGTSNRIEGNFIGTDAFGTSALGNQNQGLRLSIADNNTCGGPLPEARNIIAGNSGDGVSLGGSSGNRMEGNLIVANGGDGVSLGATSFSVQGSSNNTVGDADATDGLRNSANIITFNGRDGVQIDQQFFDDPSSTGNRILGNTIFSNGDLGIDLSVAADPPNGVTPNDPGDPDTGANNLQNYPVIGSATVSGSQLTVAGSLNSNPSTQISRKKKKKKKKRRIVFVPQVFTVQFFSNSQQDPSLHGEGEKFIGQTTVVTSLAGNAPFNSTFTLPQPVLGEFITATATRHSTADTSEVSKACPVPSVQCP